MSFTFNDHSNLEGTHAYLSASSHSWLNYTDDHMREVYFNQLMRQRGTQLHAFAEMANRLGIKMPRNHKTINEFINDGLGYNMTSEVMLFYSPNCYGTADLIGFDESKGLLRIFDLKTGAKDVLEFGQLHIYAALFCLEYHQDPMQLQYDFRLYQNDEVRQEEDPDPAEIRDIVELIVHFDGMINDMKEEARSSRAIL